MTTTETERCPKCQRRGGPGFWARLRKIHWRAVLMLAFGVLSVTFVAWVSLGTGGVISACFGLFFALAGAYWLGVTSKWSRP